ncbi:unnamed protein product [Sphagnum jensenii]|uniref:Serine protease n=1 Tax=Sphagnum jensenii TaxID=128206 RepID=A0ABP0VH80_9BRYO
MQVESRKISQSVNISDRIQNRDVNVHSEKEYFHEGLDNEEKESYPLETYLDMIPYLRETDIFYFRNKYPKDNWTEEATYPEVYGECRFTLHFGELDQNEYVVVMDMITINNCLGREMDEQSEWFLAFCDRLWIEAIDEIDHQFMLNYGSRYDDDLYQKLQEKREEKMKIHEKREKRENEDGKEYLNLRWRTPNLQKEAHEKVYTLMKKANNHIEEVPPNQKSLEEGLMLTWKSTKKEKHSFVLSKNSNDEIKTGCFMPTLPVKKTENLTKEEEEKKNNSNTIRDSNSVTISKDDNLKTPCFESTLGTSVPFPLEQKICFESNPIQEGGGHFKKIDRELRTRFEDTSSFPYSVHGIVKVNFLCGSYSTGTGILIGPDLVLTAAHNIYGCRCPNKEGEHIDCKREEYPIIQFIPGINEDRWPFGSYKIVKSYVPDEFLKTMKQEDYALLVLDGVPGSFAGYFGLHVADKELLKGKELNVIGYPGCVKDEKKEAKNKYEQLSSNGKHQLWGMKGRYYAFENGEDGEFRINYEILTSPGQSGSGVFYEIAGANEYYVIGVHVLGGPSQNIATWITMKRFNKIRSWITESQRPLISPPKITDVEENGLKELYLSSSSIGDMEAKVLSEYVTRDLQTLQLRKNSISAKGAAALSKNAWVNLKTLDLSENNIGEKGAGALSNNNSWTNLTELYLSLNNIGDDGAAGLGINKSWKNLTALDLLGNNIGAKGAKGLSTNNSWTNLTQLDLSWNNIGVEGAAALSENNSWKNLKELRLAYNKIGEEGATALSTNSLWNLTALDLWEKDIAPWQKNIVGEGQKAILDRWQNIDLGHKIFGLKGFLGSSYFSEYFPES